MGKEKSCPMVSFMTGQAEINCARDGCAWWDARGMCCGVKTIAALAGMHLAIAGAVGKRGMEKNKRRKRKEGGDNGK